MISFGNKIICLDVEATCDKRRMRLCDRDIIQIGAVAYEKNKGIYSYFDSYIKPSKNHKITPFCQTLTQISQEVIDVSPSPSSVISDFNQWLSSMKGVTRWCSWGDADLHLLRGMQKKEKISIELLSLEHMDAQAAFEKIKKRNKKISLRHALELVGVFEQAQAHNAIDDAISLSKIARKLI